MLLSKIFKTWKNVFSIKKKKILNFVKAIDFLEKYRLKKTINGFKILLMKKFSKEKMINFSKKNEFLIKKKIWRHWEFFIETKQLNFMKKRKALKNYDNNLKKKSFTLLRPIKLKKLCQFKQKIKKKVVSIMFTSLKNRAKTNLVRRVEEKIAFIHYKIHLYSFLFKKIKNK